MLEDLTVPRHVPRSQEGIKQSMALKDAMREWCVGDVVEAWYRLVASYSASRPDLAAAVLDVVHRYVGWIDIGLLVNDKCARLAGGAHLLPVRRPLC